jgi:hypothetical protein
VGSDGAVTHTKATFKAAEVVSHRLEVGNRTADKLLPGARGLGPIKQRRVGLKMKGMHAYSLELRGEWCLAKRHLKAWK